MLGPPMLGTERLKLELRMLGWQMPLEQLELRMLGPQMLEPRMLGTERLKLELWMLDTEP